MTLAVPVLGSRVPALGARVPAAVTYDATGGVGSGTLHTFTLTNTSSSTASAVYARLGLAFEAGDIPSGSVAKVRIAGGADVSFAAVVAGNTWADGSLRSTADNGLVMIDDSSTIAASGSRSYEVYAAVGSYSTPTYNPWSGTDNIPGLTNDMSVALSARSGGSDTTNRTFSIKTAAGTSTRREIIGNHARFVRLKIWEKVAGEEHIICENHLDCWLNSAGTAVKAFEFAPVLSQHWWVASPFGTSQTKTARTYTATVSAGGSTVDTRTALVHAYYCRWASLRTTNDAHHARKHWVNHDASTPMPTLRVTYADASLKKMMKAGYIPPLKLGVTTYTDSFPTTHDPLGLNPANGLDPNGHRAAINGTGPYAARGMWGNPDAMLLSNQASGTAATAENAWRKSRVMAQAGLSVYSHVRDHRSASGVNGGTDAPNRIIPAKIRRDVTQTYTGLGSLAVYAQQLISNDTGTSTLTYDAPTGGTGAFANYDSAHCCNYSGPMAFLEGEAYLGDAVVSQFNCQHFFFHFNEYNHNAYPMYWDNAGRQAAQSIPATAFGTIIHMHGEQRSLAWSMHAMSNAYMLRADAHPEQPYIVDMVRNSDDWLSYSYNYLTTAHRAKGLSYHSQFDQHWHSPWMGNWTGLAADHARRIYDFLPDNARGMNGFEEVLFLAGRYCINVISTAPGASLAYRSLFCTDDSGLVLIPAGEHSVEIEPCTFASNVGTATPPSGYSWANGDKVRFSTLNTSGSPNSNPSGTDTTTLYYMVSVSGNTFRLATSPGGSALTIGNATVDTIFIASQSFTTTPMPSGALTFAFDDDYEAITMALIETCIANSHADMTNTIRDNARAWFAPKRSAGFSDFATWNYDGDNLL